MLQETGIYTRISNKVNDSQVSPKAYWSILKMFLNNKKLGLFHLFLNENRFKMDLKRRLNYLTHFSLNSALELIRSLLSEFLLKTDKFCLI